jgi:rRNA processing protein Krr1/Pno1
MVRVDETEWEMTVRHVAEQEMRIARQEALIERLQNVGVPIDDALGLLSDMRDLLDTMRDHVKRLSK